MLELTMETGIVLLAAVALGVLSGWLIRGASNNRRIEQQEDQWHDKLGEHVRQRDRLAVEIASLRKTVENEEALVHRHEMSVAKSRTELQSEHEKTKSLKKDILTLRAEREGFKNKLAVFQDALVLVKQRSADLQTEFIKSGDFYKAELAKSFEKRQLVEAKLKNSKLEQESFNNLLHASRSERESVNNMLSAAKNRLDNLDELEQNVIQLEAENAQLTHDAALTKQEVEALQRDLAELEELKVQNKELAHCLQSMENSRKQYEEDAKRHRDQAGQSEQQSETLRIRLDEVQQDFADMEVQQRKALKDVRNKAVVQKLSKTSAAKREVDDLQKIVGIGKVFESALHKLGVFNYRQIAAFGVADIARINIELKEFKGRMEQDDWVGQAKELYFQKYGIKDIH